MRLGVIFPQLEIGPDAGAVRAYAEAVEALGYQSFQVYDHVLGADVSQRAPWPGPYRLEHQFHEVMVLLGYVAAITTRIELVTGVLVLPQRQTALVAKQAAEVDLLSGGRMRLGVGVGWNYVEYEALGKNFHDRGRRIEEQITLLRQLWTTPNTHFEGRWESVIDAGINPLPIRRPIPVWLGGHADVVIERVGRLGDGWFPQWRAFGSVEAVRAAIERIHAAARAAGRDPSAIGISGVMAIGSGSPDEWLQAARDWQAAGVTHLAVNTMCGGLAAPDGHLARLRQFMQDVAPALGAAHG